MTAPPLDIESWVYSILLGFCLLLFIFFMAPIVRRTFKEEHPNRYSNLSLLVVLVIIAILYMLPLSNWGFYAAYPVSFWCVFFAAAWGFITLVGWKILKPSSEQASNVALQQGINQCATVNIDTHNFSFSGEVRRKLIHLMSLVSIIAFPVGHMIFWLVYDLGFATAQASISWDFFISLQWCAAQPPYVQGAIIFSLGMFGTFCVEAYSEILRLRYPKVNFAFKRMMQKTRRASEVRSFGAHLSLVPCFLLGGMILTYWTPEADMLKGVMATCAVVSVSALADMIAALIGRRYGKHKWKIVPGKSIEGTLAGSITAFFASVAFVGPLLALLSVLIFNITDLALAKVRISDNLTTPLLLAVTFRLLLFLCQPLVAGFWYIPEWI